MEEDAASLKARIRQLEMEHSFMQRELDSLSEAAQRNESHIRFAPLAGDSKQIWTHPFLLRCIYKCILGR